MERDGSRVRRGEAHGSAKLTEEKVLAIRQASLDGETQKVIAERFGVTQMNVSYIVRRKTWRHLP